MIQPLRIRIQNAIVNACREADYYPVAYVEGVASASEELVHPTSVVANEVLGVIGDPSPRNPTIRQYKEWTFVADVQFNTEVVVDDLFTSNIGQVSMNDGETLVVLRPVSALAAHPPQKGSHNGSKLEITFSTSTKA